MLNTAGSINFCLEGFFFKGKLPKPLVWVLKIVPFFNLELKERGRARVRQGVGQALTLVRPHLSCLSHVGGAAMSKFLNVFRNAFPIYKTGKKTPTSARQCEV